MKKFILLFIPLVFGSCQTMMINSMFKDPQVENTATIKSFQTSNGFSTNNSFILKGDSASALPLMLKAMGTGYYIFDAEGNHLSYNGAATCKGIQFKELLSGNDKNFAVSTKDSITLKQVIGKVYNLEEKPVSVDAFKKSKYYVVSYWAKYYNGEKGYKDAVLWMEDEIKKDSLASKNVTFIKVNTDLQENWGMPAGKKGTLKFKKKKGETNMIVDLPVK